MNITNEVIKDLSEISIKKQYKKGQHIFMAGDQADYFFSVLSGEIKIYNIDTDGKETEIRRVKKGQVFGEVLVFAGDIYPIYALAQIDTVLLSYSKTKTLDFMKENKNVAHDLLQILAKRCLYLTNTIKTISQDNMESRLLCYLESIAISSQGKEIAFPIAKKDIASMLNMTPETMSRTLKKLEKNGKITLSGKSFSLR